MDLTPNDIRNYEFPGQLRGYDKDAVDEFLDQVANALEASRQENLKLSMEIESLKSQLAGLKQFEDTIKNAAIDARRNADMTVANAKQEAELLLGKANAEAEKAIESRSNKIAEIEEQLSKLELTRRSYTSKLKGLISSHLQLVEEISRSELSKEKEEMLDITDSSEVRTRKRETIATEPSAEEGTKTEEANAPGEIVSVESEDAGETPEADSDMKPDKKASDIDPELAQALQNYTGGESTDQTTGSGAPGTEPGQAPFENIVETTARAEDIPDGFVAKPEDIDCDSTDKIDLRKKESAEALVREPVSPEELEESLDEVASKFEQEMDKADNS